MGYHVLLNSNDKGGWIMAEKAIVYKVPDEVKKQSIETMKVRQETLEYLRKKGIKTIDDFVKNRLRCLGNTEEMSMHT